MYTVSIALCLIALIRPAPAPAVHHKIKTVTINSPTSGAYLNPKGAAFNTLVHKSAQYGGHPFGGVFHPYGSAVINPYHGGGFVNPLLGHSGYGVKKVSSYTQQHVGYPGFPGSYSVKTLATKNIGYPSKYGKAYGGYVGGAHLGGAILGGAYGHGNIISGGYPVQGGHQYAKIGGAQLGYGSPYGFNQVHQNSFFNQGISHYGTSINKLSGYGK